MTIYIFYPLFILYLLAPRLGSSRSSTSFVNLTEWLNKLCIHNYPLIVHQIKLNKRIPSWQTKQIANQLRRSLGEHATICRLNSHHFSWIENANNCRKSMNGVGAGLISKHSVTEITNFKSLLHLLNNNLLLGQSIPNNREELNNEKLAIFEKFKSSFPDGEIIQMRKLNSTTTLYHENLLLKLSRVLTSPYISTDSFGVNHVIAITHCGMIDAILLFPPKSNRKAASKLHHTAWQYNMKETLYHIVRSNNPHDSRL